MRAGQPPQVVVPERGDRRRRPWPRRREPADAALLQALAEEAARRIPAEHGRRAGRGVLRGRAVRPHAADDVRRQRHPLLHRPGHQPDGPFRVQHSAQWHRREPRSHPAPSRRRDARHDRAYTVLRRDVYRPLAAAFDKATSQVPRMPSVSPFELCFNSSALGFTRVGYAVAPVDLMMARAGGNWTVFGSNSLAQVAPDTACFAFVDDGWAAPSAVAVGGFQMENNFLVFDEAASRLGFSGTLLFIRTSCGNFNFSRN